jgi:isopenicillin-N epimerase
MGAGNWPTPDNYTEEMPAEVRRLWGLDPAATFLNHGSFGACPRPVLRRQAALRRQMERQPVDFLYRRWEERLDAARAAAAAFVGAEPADFAFVPNTTAGVNAVLRSLRFRPGDELLTTDHEYNACRNVLDLVAERNGARVVAAPVPFPVENGEALLAAILARVTDRTRLALVDHITSPTALVFPVARLAQELAARGVDLLVDGAHAPGMVPLDVDALGCAFYTGNFHKWVCAPKGAAFLWVRRDRQAAVRPAVTSHGANSPRTDRSRFQLEFDWTGTFDPTAWLCVPAAIECMGSLLPGGWPALMARNHRLAVAARRLLCDLLGIPAPCPEELLGSMAALNLPDGSPGDLQPPVYMDPLQDALWFRHRIELPVMPWPAPPRRLCRISAQAYNTLGEYARLAAAVEEILG